MNMEFKIVCSWCATVMRPGQTDEARTSHSICDACFVREFEAIKARRPSSRRVKAKASQRARCQRPKSNRWGVSRA